MAARQVCPYLAEIKERDYLGNGLLHRQPGWYREELWGAASAPLCACLCKRACLKPLAPNASTALQLQQDRWRISRASITLRDHSLTRCSSLLRGVQLWRSTHTHNCRLLES